MALKTETPTRQPTTHAYIMHYSELTIASLLPAGDSLDLFVA